MANGNSKRNSNGKTKVNRSSPTKTKGKSAVDKKRKRAGDRKLRSTKTELMLQISNEIGISKKGKKNPTQEEILREILSYVLRQKSQLLIRSRGSTVYRLEKKNEGNVCEWIFLKTTGEVDKDNLHINCLNVLLTEEEGRKAIAEIQKRYSATIGVTYEINTPTNYTMRHLTPSTASGARNGASSSHEGVNASASTSTTDVGGSSSPVIQQQRTPSPTATPSSPHQEQYVINVPPTATAGTTVLVTVINK